MPAHIHDVSTVRSGGVLSRDLIQVAGVHDAAEAAVIAAAGVPWLGFPLRLAVHRADTSEAEAAAIIAGLPASLRPVLITYLDRAVDIDAFCVRLGVAAVQLHGDIARAELERLRARRPELLVIKSLIVRGDNGAALAAVAGELAACVDAFITDTYDPRSGACGATGLPHDWAVSRRLVECAVRPVILAGGLTAENVRAAILAVRPAGVDVHTGVEGVDGRKSPERLRRFVAAARAGFAAMRRNDEPHAATERPEERQCPGCRRSLPEAGGRE